MIEVLVYVDGIVAQKFSPYAEFLDKAMREQLTASANTVMTTIVPCTTIAGPLVRIMVTKTIIQADLVEEEFKRILIAIRDEAKAGWDVFKTCGLPAHLTKAVIMPRCVYGFEPEEV